ncbi:DNA polymerase III subunit gamma/tau, partial [Candidatus Bipolaricaulota bacterium]|nr:DNA polymerase III subunit gamma/tau [Candidatus Bipolaricaulota bacterium]
TVIQEVTKEPYHISLYRRYRPQLFSEVVGQEEITRTLKNAVMTHDVAHAYLFSGERGIGKTSIARILARAVNCLSPQEGEPCNKCANCLTISNNRSLDIMEIDGASNRGIDHIRRLRDEVAFAPTDLKTKVYIIDEVHMLTNEAFNALLKTIEEPPPHVVFIFATTEPHKVPRTIISRCQAFDFRKIPSAKIASHLTEIAKNEGVKVTDEALSLIANRANGGMRDAIVMLEQAASYSSDKITEELLLDMLGLVGSEVHEGFLSALESGNKRSILETIDSLVDRGKDLETFLSDLVALVRDRMITSNSDTSRDIAICRGLLDVKQEIFRSLDRRIILEVGLLSLIEEMKKDGLIPGTMRPATKESAAEQLTKQPTRSEDDEPNYAPVQKESLKDPAVKGEERSSQKHHEKDAPIDAELAEKWSSLLREIEKERIAMAAFLSEGMPSMSGDRLTISFHPDHTFHKESLEKSANLQYLAGMVRRHVGENCYVEIKLDDGVERRETPSEALRKKVDLVCEVFDGTIVKEE